MKTKFILSFMVFTNLIVMQANSILPTDLPPRLRLEEAIGLLKPVLIDDIPKRIKESNDAEPHYFIDTAWLIAEGNDRLWLIRICEYKGSFYFYTVNFNSEIENVSGKRLQDLLELSQKPYRSMTESSRAIPSSTNRIESIDDLRK